MTASAILKKVREAYPEVFKELPKPKLKLVESGVQTAKKLAKKGSVKRNSLGRRLEFL